jgi:hypothetical protein
VVFTGKTEEVCIGVVIELSPDEATHLAFALGHLNDVPMGHQPGCTLGHKWEWLQRFRKQLDMARGVG